MNEGMTENQTRRLIKWLRANGHNSDEIVDCFDYINQSNKKGLAPTDQSNR